MKQFQFKEKSEKQLKADYNRRKNNGNDGFGTFSDFLAWYNNQEKKCHYCGILEIECQQIVMTGLLTSSRFPQNGVITRGKARGVWLEVDRFNPRGNYSPANCVLCCYFCNNDKSDVFDGRQYPLFFQNRAPFLRSLLGNNLPPNQGNIGPNVIPPKRPNQ